MRSLAIRELALHILVSLTLKLTLRSLGSMDGFY